MKIAICRRWIGSIRRRAFARAIQGSNSIEGYNATMDEAIAAIQEEPPLDEKTETWMAINGYRAAMTYIMQAAKDPDFEFNKQLLKSLHCAAAANRPCRGAIRLNRSSSIPPIFRKCAKWPSPSPAKEKAGRGASRAGSGSSASRSS